MKWGAGLSGEGRRGVESWWGWGVVEGVGERGTKCKERKCNSHKKEKKSNNDTEKK